MSFRRDPAFAAEVESYYGDYQGTFESDREQVRADLFTSEGVLVAYVSFAKGVKPAEVVDAYLTQLHDLAAKLGYGGKLRLLYS